VCFGKKRGGRLVVLDEGGAIGRGCHLLERTFAMQVRQLIVRSTLAAALMSAYFLAEPARAGPLGGTAIGAGGALGGSASGALGGGAGGLGLGAGGSAGATLQRDTALPRPDRKVVDAAKDTGEQATDKAHAAQTQARDSAKDALERSHDKAQSVKGQAQGSAGAAAAAAQHKAQAVKDTKPGTSVNAATEADADGGAARTPAASAGVDGQASGEPRSVNASGSARASARR
jgi:hypothetical protein